MGGPENSRGRPGGSENSIGSEYSRGGLGLPCLGESKGLALLTYSADALGGDMDWDSLRGEMDARREGDNEPEERCDTDHLLSGDMSWSSSTMAPGIGDLRVGDGDERFCTLELLQKIKIHHFSNIMFVFVHFITFLSLDWCLPAVPSCRVINVIKWWALLGNWRNSTKWICSNLSWGGFHGWSWWHTMTNEANCRRPKAISYYSLSFKEDLQDESYW